MSEPLSGVATVEAPVAGVAVRPRAVIDVYRRVAAAHIPALDGIRAIAVGLVIFYHTAWRYLPGGLGVLMFFVLSGFLITWLLLKENERTGDISLRKFYVRRFLRIFPAFYVYVAVGLAWQLLRHREVPWAHTLSAVLYVSNYYNAIYGDGDTFVSHAWSLGIEEQFYVLWPLAVVACRRNLARLTGLVAGLIVTVWAYRAILHFGLDVNQGYIYSAFDTRVDHLMVGCLLAILLRRGALAGLWRALCGAVWLPALTLALLGGSAALGVIVGSGYRNVVGFAIEPVLVAVLIVQLIVLSATAPWAWIDSAPMRYLGQISYSLYLYQQLAPAAGASRTLGSLPLGAQIVLSVGFTLVLAMASFHLVERPFLRLKERLGGGAGQPARA